MTIVWTELQPFDTNDHDWFLSCIDADGSNMVLAIEYDKSYVSTDGGVIWTEMATFGENFYIVKEFVTNSGGDFIVAATTVDNLILASADSGVTWGGIEPVFETARWTNVATTASGEIVYACSTYKGVYKATEYGSFWNPTTQPNEEVYHNTPTIACSADGAYVIYSDSSHGLYVSPDGGNSWTKVTITGCAGMSYEQWLSVSCNADGSKMVAVNEYCGIYLSTDYGVTWNLISFSPDNYENWSWKFCSISSSGDEIAIVATNADYSDSVYVTRDGNVTWEELTPPGAPAYGVVDSAQISGDGTKVLFGYYGGKAYLGDYSAPLPTYIKSVGKLLLYNIKSVNGVSISNIKSIAKVSNLGDLGA